MTAGGGPPRRSTAPRPGAHLARRPGAASTAASVQAALRQLYPAPPAQNGRRRWADLAAGVVAFLVILARVPSSLRVPWAEDAGTFLLPARHDGCIGSLGEAYAGYLNLAPRLVACGASVVPLEHAAAVIAVLAALGQAAVAVIIFRSSEALLPSPVVRVGMTAALLLGAVAGGEVLAVGANLQWLLLGGTFWVLLWQPGRVGIVVAVATAVIATLTSALALLLAPLALVRLVAVRSWSQRVVALAFGVGAALQLAAVASASRPGVATHPGIGDLALAYATRVVLVGLVGVSQARTALAQSAPLAIGLGLVVVVLALTSAWRWRPTRHLVVLASVSSVGTFFFTADRAWSPALGYETGASSLMNGNRYMVFPAFLVWVIVAAGVQSALRPTRRRRRTRLVGATLLALAAMSLAVGGLTDARIGEGPRRSVPSWATQVRAARQFCTGQPASTSVALAGAPAGWSNTLTCADLGR